MGWENCWRVLVFFLKVAKSVRKPAICSWVRSEFPAERVRFSSFVFLRGLRSFALCSGGEVISWIFGAVSWRCVFLLGWFVGGVLSVTGGGVFEESVGIRGSGGNSSVLG